MTAKVRVNYWSNRKARPLNKWTNWSEFMNLLLMAPVTRQVFQFGSVLLLFFGSTPLLMSDSCNGRSSTEVWRRHLESRSVGTQSSHRSLSTHPNSPPVLCPSTDSLFYHCRLWGRRMKCDVTLSTKHLARIWFGSDLKSDFKTPVTFVSKKIWFMPLFLSRWDQAHIHTHKSHLF